MGLLKKEDLKFEYEWKAKYANDDPRITGKPDSTLLNRGEGYEVLYFINQLAIPNGWKNKATGIKVERMIHKVPSSIRSQENVKKWIYDHWDEF